MEDILNNLFLQMGAVGISIATGWVVAYFVARELKDTRNKYDKILVKNLEIQSGLERILEKINEHLEESLQKEKEILSILSGLHDLITESVTGDKLLFERMKEQESRMDKIREIMQDTKNTKTMLRMVRETLGGQKEDI